MLSAETETISKVEGFDFFPVKIMADYEMAIKLKEMVLNYKTIIYCQFNNSPTVSEELYRVFVSLARAFKGNQANLGRKKEALTLLDEVEIFLNGVISAHEEEIDSLSQPSRKGLA